MAFNIFGTERIAARAVQFRYTGIRKYQATVTGENQVNSMLVKTVTKVKWQLHVQEILKDGYVIELLTLDNTLASCNNEGYLQLYLMMRQFNKLYNRLLVKISPAGIITELLNFDEIKETFQQIRKEAMAFQESTFRLDDYLNFDEKTFLEKENLTNLSRELEFFRWYFCGHYGNTLPYKEKTTDDNVYRTGKITWHKEFRERPHSNPHMTAVELIADYEPARKDWIQQTYGQFPFLRADALSPVLKQEGQYVFDRQTGFLVDGHCKCVEIADPNFLYNQLDVKLEQID